MLLDDCKDLPLLNDLSCQRVRATDDSRKAGPVLQALIDLSHTELTQAQDQDPNLRLIKDMISDTPKQPSFEHVQAKSVEVKNLWFQYANRKIRKDTLLRRHKKQVVFDEWQIVAPQKTHTCIFQACHHRKLVALAMRWL